MNHLENMNRSLAVLYIHVDAPILDEYQKHIQKHNQQILHDAYPNSGFDLFVPQNTTFPGQTHQPLFVSSGIKAEMRIYDTNKNDWGSTGYYMYPRSSISKTPLMLANHTGIIDSGYRGYLIGAFRNLSNENYEVPVMTRLLQICAPDLRPIYVQIIDESLFESTSRGEGGFGSTNA